jgi:tetratricopeptide (TPR) repeat protein
VPIPRAAASPRGRAARPTARTVARTVACAAFLVPALAAAQSAAGPTLAPKRSLTLPAVSACLRQAPPAAAARRDELAARGVAARARELALVGDRAGARAAFARALALDPSAAPLAYDLARAAEEAGDRAGALSAYCHFLALAPAGPDAADARARVARLGAGSGGDGTADRRARDAFARGLAALDGRRYPAAGEAFGEVLRATPNAPEAVYNRGLAQLAAGRDADAARDLAAYVASPSAGADRAEVLRAVDALRRPRWSPQTALGRGVVPGFGQLYTGRPAAGVAVFAASAAAVGAALYQRSTVREVGFVDPFGNPYTSPVTVRRRPYLAAGLGAGALVAAAAAVEARAFASRSQRTRPAVRVRAAALPGVAPGGGLVLPVGLAVQARF